MALDNQYITELEPFVLSYDEGRTNVVVSSPRKMLAAAALVSGAAIMLTGNIAHADGSNDTAESSQDSPDHVTVDKGSSVFTELRQQGYTVGEIARDMERKGIPQSVWTNLKVAAGSTWNVDNTTINERNSRLGIPEVNQTDPSSNPDTISLPAGGSIISVLKELGVKDPYNAAKQTLKYNGMSANDARHIRPGVPIAVPAGILPNANVPVTSTPNEQVVLTLEKPGDTLIGMLKAEGSNSPFLDAKEVLAVNSMTFEDAAKSLVGKGFIIPKSVSIRFNKPAKVKVQTSIITPPDILPINTPKQNIEVKFIGDSLTVGMHSLGNIDSVGSAAGMNVSSEDAATGRSLTEALNKPVNFDDILSKDVIVLELGTNAKENDNKFADNLRWYVNQIKTEVQSRGVNMPKIFVVNQFESGDKNVVRDESRNPKIDQLVEELDINKIDWASYAAAHPELYEGGDGVHPNDYNKMADFIISDIARQTTPEVVVPTVPATETPVEPPIVQTPPEIVTPAPEVPAVEAPAEVPPAEPTIVIEAPAVVEEPAKPVEVIKPTEPVVVPAMPLQPESIGKLTGLAVEAIRKSVSVNGVLSKASAQEAYNYILLMQNHPDKSGDFPNPEAFYGIPAPTLDMPWVASPDACVTELFAKPSEILATMTDIAIYEWLLQQPQWAAYRDSVLVIRDRVSGDHKTHQNGDKGDTISRDFTADSSVGNNGPVFDVTSPNYNPEMTTQMMILQGLSLNPYGENLYVGIIFGDKDVVKNVNNGVRSLGRTEKLAYYASDHSTHAHEHSNVNNESKDGIIGTPNTTKSCQYNYVNMDPDLVESLKIKRQSYSNRPTPALANLPDFDTSDFLVNNGRPTPEVAVTAQEAPVVLNTEKTNAFVLSADEYINTYNGGEHIEVKLRNSKNSVTAPAEVQRMVDYVWRVEGGVSPDVVKQALTVGLAESGLNNGSMNKSTGDRCVFQINKINKNFINKINQKYGWNIQYDNLQNDLEGCVRVAFELYKQSLGNVYTPEFINKWVDSFGLKLPDDLMNQVMNGKASDGWTAWLMSAKNTGLL